MSASRRESINQVKEMTETSFNSHTSKTKNQQTTSSRTQKQSECHSAKIKTKITTTDPNNGIQNQDQNGFPVPPISWVTNRKARYVEIASEVAFESGSEDVEEDENSSSDDEMEDEESSEEEEGEITKTGRDVVVSDDEDEDPTYQSLEGSSSEDDEFEGYESEENESEENDSADSEPEVDLRTQSKDGSGESLDIPTTKKLDGISRSSIWWIPRPRKIRRLTRAPKISSLCCNGRIKFVGLVAQYASEILGKKTANYLREEDENEYKGKIYENLSHIRQVKLQTLGVSVLETMDAGRAMVWVPRLISFTISWSRQKYPPQVATAFADKFENHIAKWLSKWLRGGNKVVARIRANWTSIITSSPANNEKWTLSETLILGMAWGTLPNWASVADCFPQRALTEVKGHFYRNLGHKFGLARGPDGRRARSVVESLKDMRGWKDVEEEYARYCMQDDPEPYFENLARKKKEDEKKEGGKKEGEKKRMLESIKKDLSHLLTKKEMEMIVNHCV